MECTVKFVFSEKGKRVLMVNHYKFLLRSTDKFGIVKWACERRYHGCKAHCATKGESEDLIEHDLRHNHDADPKKFYRQAIKNSCKRKAQEDLFEKPEKIMRTEIASSSSASENISMGDVSLIRRAMWSVRKKDLPPLPKDLGETQEALDSIAFNTERGETFLLENDREKKIVIFGCQSNLQALKESETILVDGTFQYCCSFFLQLFTVFAVRNAHYIPLLFCLLPDKKESSYFAIFSKMKAMLGGDSIRKVMADFEIGIHNAARKVWPGARIFGCRFHLTQSWYRKIQNLGLVTVYRNTKKEQRFEQESTWLRHIFGLPYLSHDEVGTSFAEDFISNLPTNPKIQKFADYLLETYVSEDAMFPPEVWASFSTEPVTTNPCESFHSHFKKKFYQAHPDVYSFTKQLLSTQTFVYIKLQSTMEPPKPSGNKVYRERRMRLLEAKEQYMEGRMIRREYIAAASCNCATV